ncbi:MAG: hypothetical protein Q9M91_00205 [Candidatus Dojkabacteria bacterium]|nr:hypothetical protein [Candidatus Dojkabacteria bacterium]MDQ7020254.1 hypothetical protein [Candidatus Dojkabacteria bacterium]
MPSGGPGISSHEMITTSEKLWIADYHEKNIYTAQVLAMLKQIRTQYPKQCVAIMNKIRSVNFEQ